MYTRTHACMHTYTHTHANKRTHTHTHANKRTHTHTHTHKYIYTHSHTNTHPEGFLRNYTNTHTHARLHSHTHTHTHVDWYIIFLLDWDSRLGGIGKPCALSLSLSAFFLSLPSSLFLSLPPNPLSFSPLPSFSSTIYSPTYIYPQFNIYLFSLLLCFLSCVLLSSTDLWCGQSGCHGDDLLSWKSGAKKKKRTSAKWSFYRMLSVYVTTANTPTHPPCAVIRVLFLRWWLCALQFCTNPKCDPFSNTHAELTH